MTVRLCHDYTPVLAKEVAHDIRLDLVNVATERWELRGEGLEWEEFEAFRGRLHERLMIK